MKRATRMMRAGGAALIAASLFNGMTIDATRADTLPVEDHLSTLTYTATGTLRAAFVAPNDGSASPLTATQVVVSTQRGAGIELCVNGAAIDAKHLGKRTVNVKTGETQYFFYGVPLAPGPNTLSATPLGAGDLRGTPVTTTVYGPADASSVHAEFGAHLVADGTTVAPLNITVLDRYGHASLAAQRVHVAILSGDVQFVDLPKEYGAAQPAATASPDVQASPQRGARLAEVSLPVGGYFSLRLQPGTVAGPLEIEIRAGSAYLRKSFYVEPYVRSAFVSGILSAGTGAVPAAVDGDGIYDAGGSEKNRIALFATGAAGKALVTAAYESQNRLTPLSSFGPFVEDPNERPYLTYGDASQVTAPYHSEDHLYARIDRGRDSIMWGQYQASVGASDVGSYQQLLSGAKADLTLGPQGNATVTAFTARNDQAFVSQILPVTGLGALLAPLHSNIVVASDSLALVTLDRSTGLILRQIPLLRNVDYTIDYATGVLRFIDIPLPYDAYFNPQVISLQYEYAGPGVESRTTGGQFSYALSSDRRTKVLLSYVNDATGTQNFALSSASLTRSWNGGELRIEHASSFGTLPNAGNLLQLGGNAVPSGGNATSLSLNERSASDAVAVAYQSTTAGYDDPFGGFSTPGTLAYRAALSHGTQATGMVSMTYDGQSNHGIGSNSRESDFAVQLLRKIGTYVTATVGLTQHVQNVPSAAASPAAGVALANTSQTQAQAALDYRLPKHIGVTVSQAMTLSGSDAGSTQPSQTAVEASYDLPKRGRIFARELWSDQPSATFANSTSNLNITSGSTRSLQVGIEQPLSAATTVSSQYVVNQTGEGVNIYDAAGVDEHLHVTKALAANVQVQAANAVGAGAQGFTLWSGTLNYAGVPSAFRSSLTYQSRTGFSGGSTLAAALAGRISPNLSTVGFVQRAYGNGVDAINDRLSLAYRPLQSDRFMSFFDYTRTNGAAEAGEAANVISLEELFRPTHRFELTGRFAYKLDGGGAYAAQTTLLSLRARQSIGTVSDVAAEVRTIDVPGATGARQTQLALETGRTLGRSTRAALGYNVAGSVDPTLVGTPQRHGFYVTVTSLVDRIFGWGKP